MPRRPARPAAMLSAPKPQGEPPVTDASYFAHETAVIDDGARIGDGTKIWHFSHVMSGAVIGRRCNVGQNVVVAPKAVVGDGCKIQNNVSLYDLVELEDDVFCGPSMVFTNVFNPRAHISRKHEYRRTLVRRGATIGANATVVCGHTIGRYAFVGAGSVVTKDVPDFGLVVGSPARRVGWMCQCGTRLAFGPDDRATCEACGWRYALQDGLCREVGTGEGNQ
jgi:UDP-2-acetamido-3-amino-2,3-dideoxy-glucuronate N-acetyltransferase